MTRKEFIAIIITKIIKPITVFILLVFGVLFFKDEIKNTNILWLLGTPSLTLFVLLILICFVKKYEKIFNILSLIIIPIMLYFIYFYTETNKLVITFSILAFIITNYIATKNKNKQNH